MKQKKIYFFIGTTAELIKLGAIIRELKARKINFKIITSGQNKIHFEDLKNLTGSLRSDIELEQKVNKSSVFYFLLWGVKTLLTSIFQLREEFKGLNKKNSYFIIQGDTVTSTIGTILAKIYGLKIVHIESGDLSFNLLEPFPEEICRNINIRLADILFAPTDWAKNNLKGLSGIKISTKENTIIESCLWALGTKGVPKEVGTFKKYYILIMHRQEHVIFRKDWSRKILELVINSADSNLNCLVLNHPLTAEIIELLRKNLPKNIRNKIFLIDRMPYKDFMKLIKHSEFMATDGASNQQEVYYMGKPCLALRDMTEQIEGLNENVILCKSSEKIIKEFLVNYKKYIRKPVKISVRPSKVVVDYLAEH